MRDLEGQTMPVSWLTRALALGAMLATAGLFVSCFGGPPKAESVPSSAKHESCGIAVVVALDGVRWQEVFEGTEPTRAQRFGVDPRTARELMPNLHRLIDQHGAAIGAHAGAPISASGPNFVSLPGYTELFTGAAPSACGDNQCARVSEQTIVDDALLLAPELGDVAVFSSWEKIELAATRSPERALVSTGRTHGHNLQVLHRYRTAERALARGRAARPLPGWGDFRPDRYTADLALAYLQQAEPAFMFVGLGETDEYAHQNQYAKYLAALTFADAFIGRLHAKLEQLEQRGTPSLLLVTSDHGRAGFVHHGRAYPESARTWLVAAGSRVSARGFVASPSARKLRDVAPTLRRFWGLSGATYESDLPEPGSVLTELFL